MSLDSAPTGPLYARFSRRVRGIVIDWIVASVAIFGALLVAVAMNSSEISRALGVLVIVALLLYEPVLVSFAGGTLGHYFTNLRVVDAQSGGNVSFPKACARSVIKAVLGWYSFVILAATRRNQAVHDLVTRSTVQIRDSAKALPGQYFTERIEPASDSGMPPHWRRIVAICVYLALLLVAFVITLYAMMVSGLLTPHCLNGDFCSSVEHIASSIADIALLVLMATIIALGWKGKLFGARA